MDDKVLKVLMESIFKKITEEESQCLIRVSAKSVVAGMETALSVLKKMGLNVDLKVFDELWLLEIKELRDEIREEMGLESYGSKDKSNR